MSVAPEVENKQAASIHSVLLLELVRNQSLLNLQYIYSQVM